MKPLAKILSAAVLLGFLLMGAPMLAQDTKVDYDQTYPFNKVKTYSWAKIQTTDSMIEPRLASAVDHMLQGLGWRVVDKGSTISVSAVEVTNARGYNRFYRQLAGYDWQRGWGGGGFADGSASLNQIQPGTLIVDLYDTNTKKLIWRGIASQIPAAATGEPTPANQKKEADSIDKTVKMMFVQFPPKSGGRMGPNGVEVPNGSDDTTPYGTHP